MTSWEATTLGAVCKAGGGAIQTGPFGSQLHASDYVETGVPTVMPKNIGDNRIIEDDIARITEVDADRLSKYRLSTNDIVYSRRGDVERRALIRSENDGWLCGTGCLKVSFGDSPVVDPAFISYFLGTQETRQWIIRHAVGATMLNLNTKILQDVPLRVPVLPEQRAIAKVLGALDDKIAANTKTAAISDELAAMLSHQSMESGHEIPLTELAEVTMGSSPAGTSLNETGEGIVFYQGIRDFGLRYPTRRVWTDSPVRLAQELDTLLSVRAPVGSTNIASESVCIGRGLASIRSRLGTPYTLFHALRSSASWQQFNSEGTVFGSINRKQLESIHLKWVDSQDLQVVETQLSSLEHVIRIATTTIGTLTSTRDALLPQLMSGELRVKDAEEIVEASI